MDAARPASELAADVEKSLPTVMRYTKEGRALVARVADVEEQAADAVYAVEQMQKWREACQAAEAQVAALQSRVERDRYTFTREAEAAEAALANTRQALNALVARVADLEAELTEWRTSIATEALTARAEAAEAQVAALTAEATAAEEARRVSDEAAATWATLLAEEQLKVAALTQERAGLEARTWKAEADRERVEAALANTRQALAEIAAMQIGATQAVLVARRALAAGDNTTEPA